MSKNIGGIFQVKLYASSLHKGNVKDSNLFPFFFLFAVFFISYSFNNGSGNNCLVKKKSRVISLILSPFIFICAIYFILL